MSDEICNCPECGRTHRKMDFGTPPDSPLITLRAELEKMDALLTDAYHGEAKNAAQRDAANALLREALGQIPNEMKDCTIVFEECLKGHGHLRGTNWIKHPCLVCERDDANAELEKARECTKISLGNWAAMRTERDAANALLREAADWLGNHLDPCPRADLRARIAAHLEKQ